MPLVFFVTYGDDGAQHLLPGDAIQVESVPRIGETVCFSGPRYGDYDGDGATTFVVDDVVYQIDDRDGEAKEAECPNVYLREERNSAFKPKCVCEDGKRIVDEDDPNRCDNCGDRIP